MLIISFVKKNFYRGIKNRHMEFFPYGGLRFLFAKQITVCSSTSQSQHQHVIFYAVNQQPVWKNVAFSMPDPISSKGVVLISFWERFTHRKGGDYLLQQTDLQAALHRQLVVFLELSSRFDRVLLSFS